MGAMRAIDLVILDCDGVLVDSEPIALDLLRETIAASGLALDAGEVQRRFQGRALAGVPGVLRETYGHSIAPERLARMEDDLLAAFATRLRPIRGIEAALDALAVPAAVASSSSRRRLAVTLEATGLADRFSGAVHSAEDVTRGKPAPDLFLRAAARAGARPDRSLVVEDSPAGIEAARAAGMRSVGFVGGGHAGGAAYRAALEVAGAARIVADARELAALFGGLSASPGAARDTPAPSGE